MASPFKVFRKNQKKMLAVLTILTVFSFSFGYALMEIIGSSGGGAANQAAFTSKYGSLKEMEIRLLSERHHKVMAVLTSVLVSAGARPEDAQRFLAREFGGTSDEDLILNWLLARRAEQEGMVVDDVTVNDFLKRITDNQVTAAQFKKAFRDANLSPQMFFRLMRDELLASKLKNSFLVSIQAVTPGQRWDSYCQLFKQATIEAVPVPVANYVDQIEDPDEKTLQEFFDEHKGHLSAPFSPIPGFKKPQRVALEYFKVNMSALASPDVISDEEVMQRYEKDQERYDQGFKPLDVDEPAVQPAGEPNSPTIEAPTTESPVPAATDTPATPESSEQNNGGASQETSAVESNSSIVQTAFQQPVGEDAAPEPSSAAGENKTQKEEAPASGSNEPMGGETPVTKANGAKDDEKTLDDQAAEQLKNFIRREIASERIAAILTDLRKELDQYRDLQNAYTYSSAAEREGQSPPQHPDFEALAKKHGISAGVTGLVDQWEAVSTDLGSAIMQGNVGALYYAFSAMPKLRPEMAQDMGDNWYLFWKVDETKEDVPDFNDPAIRECVLREWKMIEARKLAEEKAKSLVVEATEADGSLAATFTGVDDLRIITPPPFAWLTLGSVSMRYAAQPKTSAVDGLELVGDEFMETVFRLEPGKVGAAMNAPKTVAYVVRVSEFSPPYEELWKQFLTTNFRIYAPVVQQESNMAVRAWTQSVMKQADFQWTPEHIKLKTAASEE